MVFTKEQLNNPLFLKEQKIRLLKNDIIVIQRDLQVLLHPVIRAQVKILLYKKMDELVRELIMIEGVKDGTTISKND